MGRECWMQVVVLCGGQGTRLREETEFRPKPMVEIGSRPILWHIMKIFAHHGLRDFVLCLGYRGNLIKEYFLNYDAMNNDFTITLGSGRAAGKPSIVAHGQHEETDFRVTLCDTGQTAQTGARVKRIERHLVGDTFLCTYGDGLADIDISRLIAFHRAHGKLATVTTHQPTSRYGILELGEAGQVKSFAEKPRLDGWASAGFFVFNRGVLDYLTSDDACVLEREPLERLAAAGQLVAFPHHGFFFAMDTYREYQLLNDLWSRQEAPWKIWA